MCRATSEFWSYDSAGEYAGWPRVRRLAPSPPAGPESAGWPQVRRLAPSPPAGPESAGHPASRSAAIVPGPVIIAEFPRL